ncbi:hypothetical protein ACIRFF_08715 [Streptomyces cyaneofuscatus]
MTAAFTRGFRLVQRGRHLDGAEFPSGRAVVLDDPEYGLATVATSVDELLRGGYHGARIERPDEQLHTRLTELHASWLKAGGPPLGTSINRWWDQRLLEFAAALTSARPAEERPR